MYVCIFLQHYRIHMDIGNSKNHWGIKKDMFCSQNACSSGLSDTSAKVHSLQTSDFVLADLQLGQPVIMTCTTYWIKVSQKHLI